MKDKRRIYIKRVIVNVVVIAILALALWALYAVVTAYAEDVGTLKGNLFPRSLASLSLDLMCIAVTIGLKT